MPAAPAQELTSTGELDDGDDDVDGDVDGDDGGDDWVDDDDDDDYSYVSNGDGGDDDDVSPGKILSYMLQVEAT